jgi:hypothetical protein
MLHDNIKYDNLLSFYFVYEIYSLRCVWDLISQIRKINILHLHDVDGIFLPYLRNIEKKNPEIKIGSRSSEAEHEPNFTSLYLTRFGLSLPLTINVGLGEYKA